MAELISCLAALMITALCAAIQASGNSFLNVVDTPNARSSHQSPTPSAGGLAVIAGSLVGSLIFGLINNGVELNLVSIVMVATCYGLVGYLDDKIDIAALPRLTMQFLLSACLFIVVNKTTLNVSPEMRTLLIFVLLAGFSIFIVNIFNFMDGIDGFAASEAIFVLVMVAALMLWSGNRSLAWLALLGAFSCLGFLIFNWPQARLFMGDTGSGFLGFFIVGLLIVTVANHHLSLSTWLIIMGIFIVDGSVAICQRAVAGHNLVKAHRSHGYQNLSRKYRSHRLVTLGSLLINIVWLAPCALLAHVYTEIALVVVCFAYLPLIALAFWSFSGISGKYEW